MGASEPHLQGLNYECTCTLSSLVVNEIVKVHVEYRALTMYKNRLVDFCGYTACDTCEHACMGTCSYYIESTLLLE